VILLTPAARRRPASRPPPAGRQRRPPASTHDAHTTRSRTAGTGARYTLLGTIPGGGFAFEEFVRRGTPGAQPAYPGSPPAHVHPSQEETFRVLEGTMGYMLGGTHGVAALGETVTVPPGAPHFFYNAADARSDLRLHITLTPADGADAFFRNLARRAAARRAPRAARRTPLPLLPLPPP
jgi:mannose-6-phosphate isomerase-like protein (cupin superfamily)